ncbi:MAG: T9SS type A sorting domain-containing protein [Flavobacteriales bacterium]|nr:T9SS type A sorting domain-containing protein [Flavobacteriales bacterium]
MDTDFISLNAGPYFSTGQGGDYHVYPDGRVLMTGVHVLSDSIRGFEGFHSLVWFSNTGYLDTTATHRKCDNTIDLIHPLPDGKFLLSGWLNTYEGQPVGRIFRVHPDGALDSSFHTSIYWGMATDLLVQPDNKIVATGRFLMNGDPDTLHLIRLFPDGALDSTFNNHLRSSYHQYGGFFSWSGITSVSPLGHIVYGAFTSIDEQPRGGIALVDTSGVLLNTTFTGTGCGVYEDMGFPYSSVESLIPDPVGGGYYICGAYTGYDDGTTNDPQQRFVSRLYGLDVGVREVEKPLAVQVVPNPSHGPVRVELPEAIGPATLQVVDAQGRVVRVQRVAGGPAVLNLTGQAAGVYAVRVRNEAGRSGHARVLLLH